MEIRSRSLCKEVPMFPLNIEEGVYENGCWSENRIISIDENGEFLLSWRDKEHYYVLQKPVKLNNIALFDTVFNILLNYDSSNSSIIKEDK